jgi:hypothetical protein
MILALVTPTGCAYSWRKQGANVEQVLQKKEETNLRVRVDGCKKSIEVQAPWLEGDSLYGSLPSVKPPMPADWDRSNSRWNSAAIPISSIKSVEVRRFNAATTVLFLGGFIAFCVYVVNHPPEIDFGLYY